MFTLESIAVIFSLLYVILAAKENNWCWPAAVVSVSLYIYICYNAKLYPETALQIFYLLMAYYGMWTWRKKTADTTLSVTEWSLQKHILIFISGAFLTFLMV